MDHLQRYCMEQARSPGMGKASFLVTVSVILFAAAVTSWSSNESQIHQETYSLQTKLVELYRDISEGLREGAVVLLIKFLNFCVAKFAEIRYLSLTQIASNSIGSILFWVILTRSVTDLHS